MTLAIIAFVETYQDIDNTAPINAWQNYFVDNSCLVPGRTFEFMPFTAGSYSSAINTVTAETMLQFPGTYAMIEFAESFYMFPRHYIATSLWAFDPAIVNLANFETSYANGDVYNVAVLQGQVKAISTAFESVDITISSGIDSVRGQVPTRKMTSAIISKSEGQ